MASITRRQCQRIVPGVCATKHHHEVFPPPNFDFNPEPRNLIWTEITAQDTGELFFYVNDAVLPLLGISELFYGNNRGTAKVRVTRLQD